MLESITLLFIMSYRMIRIVTIHCFVNFSLMLLGHKWTLWFCNIAFIFLYPYYDEGMGHWSRLRQSFYLIFYVMYLSNTTRSLSSDIDLTKTLHKVSTKLNPSNTFNFFLLERICSIQQF